MPRIKKIKPQEIGPYDALQEFLEVRKARNLASATIDGYRINALKLIAGEATSWPEVVTSLYALYFLLLPDLFASGCSKMVIT